MGQAQINVRTRACSRTSIARTKQAALTHNVRGKELRCNFANKSSFFKIFSSSSTVPFFNPGQNTAVIASLSLISSGLSRQNEILNAVRLI